MCFSAFSSVPALWLTFTASSLPEHLLVGIASSFFSNISVQEYTALKEPRTVSSFVHASEITLVYSVTSDATWKTPFVHRASCNLVFSSSQALISFLFASLFVCAILRARSYQVLSFGVVGRPFTHLYPSGSLLDPQDLETSCSNPFLQGKDFSLVNALSMLVRVCLIKSTYLNRKAKVVSTKMYSFVRSTS